MKLFLLVVAALFVFTYANPAPQFTTWPQASKGRILGGSEAVDNQFPYQVSFQRLSASLDYYYHACGGAILSPTYVLTAGHCILSTTSLDRVRVLAGVRNINFEEDGQIVGIAEVLAHPNYEGGTGPNDVGLLRLASTLTFSEAVQPIGLPTPGAEPEGTGIFTGWGTIVGGHSPPILQFVEVPILTYQECADAIIRLVGNLGPLNPTNVCTGPLTGGISGCSGDSGSPLVQTGTNELIGITAWVYTPCGTLGAPTGFTKISAFIDFITENVPDLP